MNVLFQKLKEAALSVFPTVVIVLIINYTLSPVGTPMLLKFLLGAFFIVMGLCLFLFGVEISIDPIGQLMGSALTKTNSIWLVAVAGVVLGFIISIAEPDLHILAGQVDTVTSGVVSKTGLVVTVSAGIAAMLSLGLTRIIYNISLRASLALVYGVILVFALFTSPEFLAISFDASGATTGALTVPFILAMAIGVSSRKKDSLASENDSFGLVAIASAGAIISVMIAGIVTGNPEITATLELGSVSPPGFFDPFISVFLKLAPEVFASLCPILVVFLICKKRLFNLSKRRRRSVLIGLIYSYIGLVLLLVGANAGFINVGRAVGYTVASLDNDAVLVGTAFVLGLVTVLAEPAVHALTNQIEAVTSGYVKKNTVLAALSLGIGLALALSMLRILIPGLKLWHYLLPGYAAAIFMSFLVPRLFVGIAFDSGGVASGPMTATFILAFAQGAAGAVEGADTLTDGFGVISMVALTPLITLQILGLFFKLKVKKGGIEENGSDS